MSAPVGRDAAGRGRTSASGEKVRDYACAFVPITMQSADACSPYALLRKQHTHPGVDSPLCRLCFQATANAQPQFRP